MTAIARFEVVPVREGSMAEPIARAVEAIERHGVTYETTPTDTIIEADDLDSLFRAIQDAHEALADERRILTELEIDYQPERRGGLEERVQAVERELGHPPRSERAPADWAGEKPSRHQGSQELSRYEGGRRGQEAGGGTSPMRTTAGGSRGSTSGQGRRYGSRRF